MATCSNFSIALTVDGSGRLSVFFMIPLNSAVARHCLTTHALSVSRRLGSWHSAANARRVPGSSRRDTERRCKLATLPALPPPSGEAAANEIRSALGSAPQAMSSAMRGVLVQAQWPYATQTETSGDIGEKGEPTRFRHRLLASAPSNSNLCIIY